jgi:hypothetical protein
MIISVLTLISALMLVGATIASLLWMLNLIAKEPNG